MTHPIKFPCAVLEFTDVARDSRQMHLFVVVIGTTLQGFPFPRLIAVRLVSHLSSQMELWELGNWNDAKHARSEKRQLEGIPVVRSCWAHSLETSRMLCGSSLVHLPV